MRTPLKLNQSDFKLKIVKDLGYLYPNENSKQKRRYAIFSCKCGKDIKVSTSEAKKSKTMCNECYYESRKTHGMWKTRLYYMWGNMNKRCNIEALYVEKGITVCDEWKMFKSFMKWALSSGYKDDLTIDRINNDGNYEPSNCRFTNHHVQMCNTRRLKSTNKSGYRGVSWHKKAKKWVAQIRVNKKEIYLGLFEDKIECARYRDDYVKRNNLPHTLNFA